MYLGSTNYAKDAAHMAAEAQRRLNDMVENYPVSILPASFQQLQTQLQVASPAQQAALMSSYVQQQAQGAALATPETFQYVPPAQAASVLPVSVQTIVPSAQPVAPAQFPVASPVPVTVATPSQEVATPAQTATAASGAPQIIPIPASSIDTLSQPLTAQPAIAEAGMLSTSSLNQYLPYIVLGAIVLAFATKGKSHVPGRRSRTRAVEAANRPS